MLNSKCLLFVLISTLFVKANSQDEADFYTECNHLVSSTKAITEYGAIADDEGDDSQALQDAIDFATAQVNGGKVLIPSGIFYLKQINLKSNVHIEIDKEAIIKITAWEDPENLKNYMLFNLNVKNDLIENVSIRCAQENERYTIDFRNLINKNIRAYQLNNVENFYVADFNVIDDITRFSCVTFGYEVYSPSPEGWNSPKNGIVKNGDVRNAHYGYGLIQAQAATNTLFKNLSGEGGVTLRFETGYDKMNELQIGGIFDCYGRNISCVDGNAAYMMSPHAIHNGHVDIQGVDAVNCGFAVRIGNGYVKKDQEGLPGVTPGTFAGTSIVKDVTATYGTSAQVKSKHFKYMPCTLRHLISPDYNPDGESYSAPAVAPFLNGAEGVGAGYFNVNISNVSSNGFTELSKDILVESDAVADCDETAVRDLSNDKLVTIYPNPFKDEFSLELATTHGFTHIELMDMSGRKLLTKSINIKQEKLNVNISSLNLPKGFYLLALYNSRLYGQKKLLKI